MAFRPLTLFAILLLGCDTAPSLMVNVDAGLGDALVVEDAAHMVDASPISDASPQSPVLGFSPITDYEWDHPTYTRGVPFNGSNNYNDCTTRTIPEGFPDRANDDYLHEEEYAAYVDRGLMIIDHCLYVKLINTIMPAIRETTPEADFCGIDYVIRNPANGETIRFYDVYNYKDESGAPAIFNLNVEATGVWPELIGSGSTSGAMPIRVIHVATGGDASNGHSEIGATFSLTGL